MLSKSEPRIKFNDRVRASKGFPKDWVGTVIKIEEEAETVSLPTHFGSGKKITWITIQWDCGGAKACMPEDHLELIGRVENV